MNEYRIVSDPKNPSPIACSLVIEDGWIVLKMNDASVVAFDTEGDLHRFELSQNGLPLSIGKEGYVMTASEMHHSTEPPTNIPYPQERPKC